MLEYFNSKLITYIEDNKTKDEVLEVLTQLIQNNNEILKNTCDFYDNILKREKLGSTGIGQGIAIPHTRVENIEKPIISVALLKNPVDFSAPDGKNVKLIILIAIPKGDNKKYLSFISNLMRTLRDSKVRNNLLCSRNYDELLEGLAELS